MYIDAMTQDAQRGVKKQRTRSFFEFFSQIQSTKLKLLSKLPIRVLKIKKRFKKINKNSV